MFSKATAMMKSVKSKTKTVRYIPITGINQKTITSVRKTLKSVKKSNCDALLIGINSSGSVVDAEILGEMLQKKAKKEEIPLVMYAEEACVNGGMHLLTYGDHMLANPMSNLGNIGTVATPTILKHHMHKLWLLEVKMVHQGENKVRFNRFADSFKQDDIDWALRFMN
jgi:ClpP class serine protease